MAIGIDNNYYGAYSSIMNRSTSTTGSSGYNDWYNQLYGGSTGTSSTSSMDQIVNDYNSIKSTAAEMYKKYTEGSSSSTVKSLKQDSANFLTSYTDKMTSMANSSKALQGKNLDKLIGDVSDGKISDESVKKVTDAMQKMVDSFNSSLTSLNSNADRGSGVVRQIGRMVQSPASEKTMQMVGISTNKDGTLSLDADKLKEALTSAAAGDAKVGDTSRMDLIKDIIGGSSGVAAGIKRDAQDGLSQSAASLIGNDLAKISSEQSNSYIGMTSMYSKSGAYNMMNMGVVGLLMNVTA